MMNDRVGAAVANVQWISTLHGLRNAAFMTRIHYYVRTPEIS